MNKLPPIKNAAGQHSICLILEGLEEKSYFDRLKELSVFSRIYNIKLINAKSESSIPAKYQEAFSSDSYEIVLIVCDQDRKPEEYNKLVQKIDTILGEGKSENIITFTRPCTLQVILSHFGEVNLTTQDKKAAQSDVERLTGVKGYNAHIDQLEEICGKIYHRTYDTMKERVESIGDNPDEIPSSNILRLFRWLESDDPQWISDINTLINGES